MNELHNQQLVEKDSDFQIIFLCLFIINSRSSIPFFIKVPVALTMVLSLNRYIICCSFELLKNLGEVFLISTIKFSLSILRVLQESKKCISSSTIFPGHSLHSLSKILSPLCLPFSIFRTWFDSLILDRCFRLATFVTFLNNPPIPVSF